MNKENKTILEKIVIDKYIWLDFYKKKLPYKIFCNSIQKSNRNFYINLSKKKNKFFIFECKKASPSCGILRADFNLNYIAKIYKKYATAISVLTDEKYFHGNFYFLNEMSKLVFQPILCKDFIIDPWQIYYARLNNADAILLMLSILNDDKYLQLRKLAHNLNMGVLTEVTTKEEMNRAIKLKAKVIGINNRNLNDLSIDINRTCNLSKLVPKNETIIISESGIKNYNQIRKLSNYVDGFLIGSVIMQEKNINLGINKLILGENKICGINLSIDAKVSYKAGAIYGGLIFVPNSPRCIKVENAYKIILNNNLLKYVGVFYNTPIKKIVDIVDFLNLKIIQLHGQEDEIYIKKLLKFIPDTCLIWKSIDMNIQKNILNKFIIKKTYRFLLDNGGGTGKTFNWSLINKKFLYKTILAGGLSEYNCSDAAKIGCIGLDFNSGIESSPGIKDHKKLFKVFENLRKY